MHHEKSHAPMEDDFLILCSGSLPLSAYCSTIENMSSHGDRALEGVVRRGEGLMAFTSLLFSEGMPTGSNLPRVSCRESQGPWLRWLCNYARGQHSTGSLPCFIMPTTERRAEWKNRWYTCSLLKKAKRMCLNSMVGQAEDSSV